MTLCMLMISVDTNKPWSLKERIDNLDFFKIKNFCSVKDNVNKRRIQGTDYEQIFARDIFDKGLLSKIYQKFPKLKNRKLTTWYKNAQRIITNTSLKKIYRRKNKHIKKVQHHMLLGNCKIKQLWSITTHLL